MKDGSTVSRFFKGVLSIGLGSASLSILGLVASIVAVRYLPLEDYGAFVLVLVVANFLVEVSALGLTLAIPKYIASANEPEEQAAIINTMVTMRVATLLLAGALGYVARAPLAALFGSEAFLMLIDGLPLLTLVIGMNKLLGAMLQGTMKFEVIGSTNTTSSILNLVLIIILLPILSVGVWGLVWARVLSLLIANWTRYVELRVPRRIQLDWRIMGDMLRFSRPLYLNDVLTFLFSRIDTLLIGTFLGPVEIALFEVARKIPESLIMAYDAFRAVYFPFIARFQADGQTEKSTYLINESLRWWTFLSSLLAFGGLLFGKEGFELIFTQQYLASVPAFNILMIAFIFLLVDYTLGYSLVAIGESDKPMYINIFRTAIILSCNLLFLPTMGVIGAAVGSLLGFILATPLNFVFLRQKDIRVDSIYVFKPVAITVVFFVGVLVLQPGFIEKIVLVPVFVLVCGLFSVFTLSDVRTVTREFRTMTART